MPSSMVVHEEKSVSVEKAPSAIIRVPGDGAADPNTVVLADVVNVMSAMPHFSAGDDHMSNYSDDDNFSVYSVASDDGDYIEATARRDVIVSDLSGFLADFVSDLAGRSVCSTSDELPEPRLDLTTVLSACLSDELPIGMRELEASLGAGMCHDLPASAGPSALVGPPPLSVAASTSASLPATRARPLPLGCRRPPELNLSDSGAVIFFEMTPRRSTVAAGTPVNACRARRAATPRVASPSASLPVGAPSQAFRAARVQTRSPSTSRASSLTRGYEALGAEFFGLDTPTDVRAPPPKLPASPGSTSTAASTASLHATGGREKVPEAWSKMPMVPKAPLGRPMSARPQAFKR